MMWHPRMLRMPDEIIGMGDLLGAAFHLYYLRKPNLFAALNAAHRAVATAERSARFVTVTQSPA